MRDTVLVTGCSSGIGAHTARDLRKRGYEVIVTARDAHALSTLRAEGFTALALDLSSECTVSAFLSALHDIHPQALYGVFLNAAYGQPGALEDLPTHALATQFQVNLFSWHQITQALLAPMIAAGRGRIILNSSVLGLVAFPYRGAYNASKFALEGWAQTLRLELQNTGVQVSLIEPGPIESQFRANALIHFNRHIDAHTSRHRQAYVAQIQRLEAKSGTSLTLGPEAVSTAVYHALDAKKARLHYPITKATKVIQILRRLLPARWLDYFIRHVG